MASTYTTSLKIQEIGSGEQSGSWGTTTNTNWTLIEQAVAGVQSIVMANANYTLTNLNGVSDEARNMVLVVTGTNSGIYQIIAPLNQPKMYVIYNNTTGGYAITIGASSGSIVTIPNGVTAQVYTDGTNFYSAQTGSAGGFNINGDLTVNGNAYGQKGFDGTTVTAQGYGLRVRMDSTNTGALLQFTNNAANVQIGNIVANGSTLALNPPTGGTITAPTASPGTNTTQIATTAFALANGIPSGAIVMWSGSIASIPSGWYLCNGANGTPNLQDRFIVGAGSAYAVAATGGSADAVVVAHSHTAVSNVTDPQHQHLALDPNAGTFQNYAVPNGGSAVTAVYNNIANGTFQTGSAATGVTVSTSIASQGVSGTNANLPPYYALAYIMKT